MNKTLRKSESVPACWTRTRLLQKKMERFGNKVENSYGKMEKEFIKNCGRNFLRKGKMREKRET